MYRSIHCYINIFLYNTLFYYTLLYYSKSEGNGEDLLQLIQVGFSVMNRLLLLRVQDQISPVEVALSSQPAGYQNQHIVAVIAG